MPTTYRVILTAEARSNVRSIAAYIRKDSPTSAASVAETLLRAIDSLAQMPMRFRRVGKSRRRGAPVHAAVVRPFIIYYGVEEQPRPKVHVLRVLHGRQRQPKRFP